MEQSRHAPFCIHLYMVERETHICWGGGKPHGGGHELSVEGVSARYGEVVALQNMGFSACCGHTLALIGPNGAGKSTLIHILAGLLKPTEGNVLWKGNPLHETRQEIAFMPQRSEVDWQFPLTVRQLVEMGRYPSTGMWGKMQRHDVEIVDKALAALDLSHLQTRQIGALSGGQQQRAFLARALAQEAHILLLDEPFTGLDVPGIESLGHILRNLAAEGRLVIASHHDLGTASQIFDLCLLFDKSPIAFGPTPEVLTEAHLRQAFGARPLTSAP